MNFEPFLNHWQSNKNCSPQTVKSYRADLQLFGSFLKERGISRMSQVDHAVISQYIEFMRQKPNPRFGRTGLADSSIARRLAVLSSYFEYIRATGNPKQRNPMRDLTRKWKKNNEPKPVDELILNELLQGITVERDRVLICLFLATGLRVSELHRLDRQSISFDVELDAQGVQHFGGSGEVLGKGGKRRKLFVDEQTLEILANYLAKRTDSNPAMFLSERKMRMSVRAIQYTLANWCRKLGLPHTNVHRLRHSFATRLANAQISSLVLKELMGHASLSTTQQYFKLHDTTLARGYFAAMECLRR